LIKIKPVRRIWIYIYGYWIDGTTLSKPSRFISEMSTDKAQGWLDEDEF
jgi:hypothetical protein